MQTAQIKTEEGFLKTYLNKIGGNKYVKLVIKQRYLVMMSFPFVIWLIIFAYIPLWGWTMAFQNYKPGLPFEQQSWVGLKYFILMFKEPLFYQAMRNTLAMSLMGLVVGFTLPVALALMLNEIKNVFFKRTVQTISYLPYFVSWVIVASIVQKMLSIDNGAINQLLMSLHIIDEPIQFMAKPHLFWWIVTAADTWKNLGWNSIIFLAAISGISPDLYESATIDGAGRFAKMRYITLPGIMPTIVVILIMSIGNLINIGFERQYLLKNNLVSDYSNVLDLYILQYGIQANRLAFGTAVGIFKSVISVILVFLANWISKRSLGYRVM